MSVPAGLISRSEFFHQILREEGYQTVVGWVNLNKNEVSLHTDDNRGVLDVIYPEFRLFRLIVDAITTNPAVSPRQLENLLNAADPPPSQARSSTSPPTDELMPNAHPSAPPSTLAHKHLMFNHVDDAYAAAAQVFEPILTQSDQVHFRYPFLDEKAAAKQKPNHWRGRAIKERAKCEIAKDKIRDGFRLLFENIDTSDMYNYWWRYRKAFGEKKEASNKLKRQAQERAALDRQHRKAQIKNKGKAVVIDSDDDDWLLDD